MHRLYLDAANEFTLNPSRPRQGFGAPLPPVPAKICKINSKPFKIWPQTLRLFLTIMSGHLNSF